MDSAVTRLPGVLFCGMIRLSLIASEEHMPMMACGRRDISDSIREKPEPRLPGREGSRDGGRERRPPGHEPRKGGLNTKSHLTADAHDMPVRAFATRGAAADRARAIAPIDGFAAERLLADKGHNRDGILARAERRVEAAIPPKKNRKGRRDCDREPCRARYPMENVFPHWKRWRGVATRYAKHAASFLAAVRIGCILLWASIS